MRAEPSRFRVYRLNHSAKTPGPSDGFATRRMGPPTQACQHEQPKEQDWGLGGIEPPTSPTLKENHTTRPKARARGTELTALVEYCRVPQSACQTLVQFYQRAFGFSSVFVGPGRMVRPLFCISIATERGTVFVT